MIEDQISVCMGSSCFARGNNLSLELITRYIADNNLDARIDLRGNLCQGACSRGPNIVINGTRYEGVRPENIADIMRLHFAGRP